MANRRCKLLMAGLLSLSLTAAVCGCGSANDSNGNNAKESEDSDDKDSDSDDGDSEKDSDGKSGSDLDENADSSNSSGADGAGDGNGEFGPDGENGEGTDNGEFTPAGEPVVTIDDLEVLDEFELGYNVADSKDGQYYYNDGIAIVPCNKPGEGDYDAIVDYNGNALMMFSRDDYSIQILDGVIFAHQWSTTTYTLYDRTGEILFSRGVDDNTKSVVFCGYANGTWLFKEERSSFTESGYYMVAVDIEGNVQSEYQVDSTFKDMIFEEYGDGLIVGRGYDPIACYNTNDQTLYYLPYSKSDNRYTLSSISHFTDGKAMAYFYDTVYFKYVITVDEYLALGEEYDFSKRPEGENYHFDNPTPYEEFINTHECISREKVEEKGEGIFYVADLEQCYDICSDTYFSLPDYGETVTSAGMGNYYGGFADYYVYGADGYLYVTVIDKEGNTLYEPVCLNDVNYSHSICYGGYVLFTTGNGAENYFYLNQNGEFVTENVLYNIFEDIDVTDSSNEYQYLGTPSTVLFSEGYGFFVDSSYFTYCTTWKGDIKYYNVKINEWTKWHGVE